MEREGKMQTYVVQLRGEDEDNGDDQLALAERHYFRSSVLSFIFCFWLSFYVGSLYSISSACLLLAHSCSMFFFVFVCSGGAQPETRLALLRWLANAPQQTLLPLLSI